MSSNRRESARRARRVPVRFWRRGDDHPFPGYTTNISATGMFVVTTSPPPSGTRLRIEVLDASRGFVVEARVAHARRVRAELQHVTQSGMGVRFVVVEELVRELFPEAGAPAAAADPLAEPAAETVEPAAEAPAVGGFSVRFASAAQFLEVYSRDLMNGGLFVSTASPGRMSEVVQVEIHPPAAGAAPVRLQARVVQVVQPRAGAGGPNLLAGMGVELLDPRAVLEQLAPVVQRLQAEPA